MPEETLRILEIEKGKLKSDFYKTLDIDALFGSMHFDVFVDNFKPVLEIELDNCNDDEPKHTIKTEHVINTTVYESKPIKDFPQLYIGKATTANFGEIDIFIVITEIDDFYESYVNLKLDTYEEIKKAMETLITEAPGAQHCKITPLSDNLRKEKLQCKLKPKYFGVIFERLIKNNLRGLRPCVYFESFGSKSHTITENLIFEDLLKEVGLVFQKEAFPWVYIDSCISVSFGAEKVTLATNKFFERVKLKPNYNPLFSDTVLNCHQNTFNYKLGEPNQAGIFKNVYKVNFYSTFAYQFEFDKTSTFKFPLTIAQMLTNFYGHRIYSQKNKFNKLYYKYREIFADVISHPAKGMSVYRCEMRTKLKDAAYNLASLNFELCPTVFGYYYSISFFSYLQENINLFTNIIKTGIKNRETNNNDERQQEKKTVDDFTISIITEYIFRNIFLMGADPNSILTKIHNQYIKENIGISSDSVRILYELEATVFGIYQELTEEDKKRLVMKQIKLVYCNDNKRSILVTDLIDFTFELRNCCSGDFKTFIGRMLKTYLKDILEEEFDSFEKFTTSYEGVKTLSVKKILQKAFISSKSNQKAKSTVPKIMFDLIKERFNYDKNCYFLETIYEYMQNEGIKVFPFGLNSKTAKIVNLEYSASNDIDQERSVIEVRKTILKELNDKISEENIQPMNIGQLTDDELIRLVNAMFKYKGKFDRFSKSLFDFSYGFYPVRNSNWLKNRVNQTLNKIITKNETEEENKSYFKDFIEKARIWTPEKFTIDQRKEYLKAHIKDVSPEMIDLVSNLVKIDSELWYDSKFTDEIHNASDYDIFYGVAKNAKNVQDKRSLIKRWSEETLPKDPKTSIDKTKDVKKLVIDDSSSDNEKLKVKANIPVDQNKKSMPIMQHSARKYFSLLDYGSEEVFKLKSSSEESLVILRKSPIKKDFNKMTESSGGKKNFKPLKRVSVLDDMGKEYGQKAITHSNQDQKHIEEKNPNSEIPSDTFFQKKPVHNLLAFTSSNKEVNQNCGQKTNKKQIKIKIKKENSNQSNSLDKYLVACQDSMKSKGNSQGENEMKTTDLCADKDENNLPSGEKKEISAFDNNSVKSDFKSELKIEKRPLVVIKNVENQSSNDENMNTRCKLLLSAIENQKSKKKPNISPDAKKNTSLSFIDVLENNNLLTVEDPNGFFDSSFDINTKEKMIENNKTKKPKDDVLNENNRGEAVFSLSPIQSKERIDSADNNIKKLLGQNKAPKLPENLYNFLSEHTSQSECILAEKIFFFTRYRVFRLSDISRKIYNSSTYHTKKLEFKSTIDLLHEKKILCKIPGKKQFKFCLVSLNGKETLPHDVIMEFINKCLLSNEFSFASADLIYENIADEIKPQLEDFTCYLDDLYADKFIEMEEKEGKNLYGLSNKSD